VRYFAPGRSKNSAQSKGVSARYPSATQPDSWVAQSVRSLVKSGITGASAVRLPAYPRKRTLPGATGMSALCQKRTSCVTERCLPTTDWWCRNKAIRPASMLSVPHRIKQRFRTASQFRRSEPSPTPPRTSLGLWRGEHLRHPLLPQLHREARESLKTQQTPSGQLHRSAI
jgi:hypothetical protein